MVAEKELNRNLVKNWCLKGGQWAGPECKKTARRVSWECKDHLSLCWCQLWVKSCPVYDAASVPLCHLLGGTSITGLCTSDCIQFSLGFF